MNGSRVMAKIAGIESTAKIRSVTSITIMVKSERGQHPPPIHVHLKVFVMKFARNRKDPTAHPQHPTLGEIVRWTFSKEHLRRRDQQEETEEIKNEMKALH